MKYKIEPMIDGRIGNLGVKIKCYTIKVILEELRNDFPERRFELVRERGLWFIAELVD